MVKKILIIFTVMLAIAGVLFFKQKQNTTAIQANSKYNNCELGDLVGDDVERISVSKYYIDYHSNDFNKQKITKLANECIKEGINSQYEMDCCISKKIYGE